MASVRNISVAVGILIILILFGWIFTAPYLSNQGLGRTPGLIIGGTLTDAPADFTIHNDLRGPLKFKPEGFSPIFRIIVCRFGDYLYIFSIKRLAVRPFRLRIDSDSSKLHRASFSRSEIIRK